MNVIEIACMAAAALLPAAGNTDEGLESLLGKAGAYVVAYEQEFSAVVAEEEYLQYVLRASGGMPVYSRSLHSDVLLAPTAGGLRWLLFRDVHKVDGRSVRDPEARLQKLWRGPPGSALEQGRALLQESARYNLGRTRRNFNIPTLPLGFVHPESRDRFEFQLKGRKKVEGKQCRVLDYREVARPTLIRERPSGLDLFLRGRFFVQEQDGAILKSELAFDSRGEDGRVRILVEYRWVEDMGLWLPHKMDESYESRRTRNEAHLSPGSEHIPGDSEFITCKATYRNYRRFEVQTEERFRLPE